MNNRHNGRGGGGLGAVAAPWAHHPPHHLKEALSELLPEEIPGLPRHRPGEFSPRTYRDQAGPPPPPFTAGCKPLIGECKLHGASLEFLRSRSRRRPDLPWSLHCQQGPQMLMLEAAPELPAEEPPLRLITQVLRLCQLHRGAHQGQGGRHQGQGGLEVRGHGP